MAPMPHFHTAAVNHLHAAAPARGLRSNCAKHSQDVESEPAHRGRGVEGLGDEQEGTPRRIEMQGAAEAVDLEDHHHVDPARIDVRGQALQGGSVQGVAGHADVIVAAGDQALALVLLAGDVGVESPDPAPPRRSCGCRLHSRRCAIAGQAGGWCTGCSCRNLLRQQAEESVRDQHVPVIPRATAGKDR